MLLYVKEGFLAGEIDVARLGLTSDGIDGRYSRRILTVPKRGESSTSGGKITREELAQVRVGKRSPGLLRTSGQQCAGHNSSSGRDEFGLVRDIDRAPRSVSVGQRQ